MKNKDGKPIATPLLEVAVAPVYIKSEDDQIQMRKGHQVPDLETKTEDPSATSTRSKHVSKSKGKLESSSSSSSQQEELDEESRLQLFILITQTLGSSLTSLIRNVLPGDVKGLLKVIKQKFDHDTKQSFRRERIAFNNMKFSNNTKFDEFIQEMEHKRTRINADKDRISEEDMLTQLFASLEGRKEFATTIEMIEDLEGLTWGYAVTRLRGAYVKYHRQLEKGKGKSDSAFLTMDSVKKVFHDLMNLEWHKARTRFDPANPCRFNWLKSGCKFGKDCKFSHKEEDRARLWCSVYKTKGQHHTMSHNLAVKEGSAKASPDDVHVVSGSNKNRNNKKNKRGKGEQKEDNVGHVENNVNDSPSTPYSSDDEFDIPDTVDFHFTTHDFTHFNHIRSAMPVCPDARVDDLSPGIPSCPKDERTFFSNSKLAAWRTWCWTTAWLFLLAIITPLLTTINYFRQNPQVLVMFILLLGGNFVEGSHTDWNPSNSSIHNNPSLQAHALMVASNTTHRKTWIVDSGASVDLTPNAEDLDPSTLGIANTALRGFKGKRAAACDYTTGTVHFNCNGNNLSLDDVLLDPTANRALMSESKLDKSGHIILTGGGKKVIYDKYGNMVGTAVLRNGLYEIDHTNDTPTDHSPNNTHTVCHNLCECPNDANIAETWTGDLSKAQLWHQRLGHLAYQAVRNLFGLKKTDECFCPACVLAKSHARPVSKHKITNAKHILEIMSSDVCGPFRTQTPDGKKYFVTFIDHYSRFTWVSLVRRKSDVFKVFKILMTRLHNRHGYYPAVLHSDGGGEYISDELIAYCEKHGIARTNTTRNSSSKQNGIAERKNRTLQESALAMRVDAGLPETFWGYAVTYATYIANRLPRPSLNNLSPLYHYERGNIDPRKEISRIKTFGCLAYPHIEKARKGAIKARPSVFLGMDPIKKGYLFMDLKTKTLISTRSATFAECIRPYKGKPSDWVNNTSRKVSEPISKAKIGHPDESYITIRIPKTKFASFDNSTKIDSPIVEDNCDSESVASPTVILSDSESESPAVLDRPRRSTRIRAPSSAAIEAAQNSQSPQNSKISPKRVHFENFPSTLETPPVRLFPRRAGVGSTTEETPVINSFVPRRAGGSQPDDFTDNDSDFDSIEESKCESEEESKYDSPSPQHDDAVQNETILHVSSAVKQALDEPTTRKQMLKSVFAPECQAAELKELEALFANRTWELVELPPGKHALSNRWVYKTKLKEDGSLDKFKARLVVKGFEQIEGIDFAETYASTAKFNSFRTVCAIAALLSLNITHIDFSNAFLNGKCEEEIYMKQPDGYVDENQPHAVCRLLKCLYGLKQAPRAWSQALSAALLLLGFTQCVTDESIFVKNTGKTYCLISAHVDPSNSYQ